MSRPPEEDSRLQAILDEVREALDEAGIQGLEMRNALLQGVREALGEAGAPREAPEMTVVDGGRSADEPRAEGPKPALSVAEGDGDGVSRIKVYVTRDGREQEAAGTPNPRLGQIALSGGVQTVFHGATPRAYRLHCERGSLRVSLDGQPAEQLEAGQSLDVEARLIRLAAEGSAGGWYHRLGEV